MKERNADFIHDNQVQKSMSDQDNKRLGMAESSDLKMGIEAKAKNASSAKKN